MESFVCYTINVQLTLKWWKEQDLTPWVSPENFNYQVSNLSTPKRSHFCGDIVMFLPILFISSSCS